MQDLNWLYELDELRVISVDLMDLNVFFPGLHLQVSRQEILQGHDEVRKRHALAVDFVQSRLMRVEGRSTARRRREVDMASAQRAHVDYTIDELSLLLCLQGEFDADEHEVGD